MERKNESADQSNNRNMSNYTIKAKHKKTGEIHEIFCHDDYYSGHKYGYKTLDGRYINEKTFCERYEALPPATQLNPPKAPD